MTHRIRQYSDFKKAVKGGKKFNSPHLVIYVYDRNDEGFSRLGVIVSKAVGNAVTRNLIKRRIKNIFFDLQINQHIGKDIVVRAKDNAKHADNAQLKSQFSAAVIECVKNA